jgi:hypothetical protein
VSALVYVHGTNGSGKSTLARAVLAAAGGAQCEPWNATKEGKAFITESKVGVYLLGKYGNACGGLDGYSPYALVLPAARATSKLGSGVFAEGLITPGVETCHTLASYFDRAVFLHLATPVEDCILHVLARRTRKANDKPYDPANLYKKAQSAASWADRLERSGLEVHRLNYRQAYSLTLDVLGLDSPDVETLLS